MARPRVIEIEGGTVSLQGFSTERANQLQELLEGKKNTPVTTEGNPPKVVSDNLDQNAIGMLFNEDTKVFEVYLFKYNKDTKEVAFTQVKNAGRFVTDANNLFKVDTLKLRILQ